MGLFNSTNRITISVLNKRINYPKTDYLLSQDSKAFYEIEIKEEINCDKIIPQISDEIIRKKVEIPLKNLCLNRDYYLLDKWDIVQIGYKSLSLFRIINKKNTSQIGRTLVYNIFEH